MPTIQQVSSYAPPVHIPVVSCTSVYTHVTQLYHVVVVFVSVGAEVWRLNLVEIEVTYMKMKSCIVLSEMISAVALSLQHHCPSH